MQVSPDSSIEALTIERRGPIHGSLTQVYRHTSRQIGKEDNHEWAAKQVTNLNMSADRVLEFAIRRANIFGGPLLKDFGA